MKKYTVQWKEEQQKTNGGWAQKNNNSYYWHYIQYGTEYTKDISYITKKECELYESLSPENKYANIRKIEIKKPKGEEK